jgi:hypothetical protein
MLIDISFLNSDLVISGVLAFLAGMAGMMAHTKIRNAGTKRGYQADEVVVEAVVLEYTRRLRDYDKVIAELRARLDIMEVRSQPYVTSQSRQPQPHVAPVSEPAAVTQHATAVEERQENNGTTDYILKLLVERPRTSREVQHAVGRTREHTARLMKKLHDSGLVSRDVNSKPFKYAITGSGQERLKEKTEVASEPPSVV